MHPSHHQSILDLLYSGQPPNVELAIQLAKQENLDIDAHILPLTKLHQDSQLSNNKSSLKNNKLPDIICEVLNTKELHIMYSHDVSPALGKLSNLETLTFEHFTWSVLPRPITQLTQLRVLRLNYGFSFRRLGAGIGQLTQLEQLNVDANALEELPPEIGCLSNLQLLSVRSNCLHSLPEELSQLQALKKLHLAQNDFRRELIPAILTNKNKTNKVIVNALRRIFKW